MTEIIQKYLEHIIIIPFLDMEKSFIILAQKVLVNLYAVELLFSTIYISG